MSKTYRTTAPRTQRIAETSQKAIDRLRDAEAQEAIREALAAPQEAQRGH